MATKISTNDDYVVTHTNIREGANITLSHTENPTTTIVGLSTNFSDRVDNVELDLNEAKQELVEAQSDIASLDADKQDKLTASQGVKLSNNTLTFDTIDGYNGDLNNLTRTQIVKPVDNCPNLPSFTGVYGNGILQVTRLGDVATQVYTTFNNSGTYLRVGRYLNSNPTWYAWKSVFQTIPEQPTWINDTITWGVPCYVSYEIYNQYVNRLTISVQSDDELLDINNVLLTGFNTVTTWYGEALTRHPVADVVFKYTNTAGVVTYSESRMLYKIEDGHVVPDTTRVTSAALAEHLTDICSISFL